MEKVLQGIRVFDFATYKAGPWCGALLADMGAEVIRVEKPSGANDRFLSPIGPHGEPMYLIFTTRNKKSITLNLRSERGQQILKELVKRADVVIENFGVRLKESLGFGYHSLKEINPAIISVSVSAFGQTGPYAQRLGVDHLAQAISGMMSVTGFPGEPVRTGTGVVDFAAGIYAALGTLLALYHRQRTSEGQEVDISLLDVAVSFMESTFAEYKVTGAVRPQLGNRSFFAYPCDIYKAKDGRIFIMILGERIWQRFLNVIGKEEIADNPMFQGDHRRVKNYRFLESLIQEWVEGKTIAEIDSALTAAGIPCSRVNTIPEAFADPQINAREMIVELEHPGLGEVPVTGVPIKLSQTPGKIEKRAPMLGEHNEEIYCALLGYSKEEFHKLKEEGVI